MDKKEFEKSFEALKKSHKIIRIELNNTDCIYAISYEDAIFAEYSVWLTWRGHKIALVEYSHIDHLE